MKILYLHQYFKFPYENGGTRSYDLSRKFIDEGKHAVNVLTTTSNPKFKQLNNRWVLHVEDKINIHYLYLPYDNSFSLIKRIIIFLKFLFFATFKILKMNADVVLATSTPLTVGIIAILKKIYDKTPFIFEVRDVWPEAPIAMGIIRNPLLKIFLYFLEKNIYNQSKFIIPLSVDMKDSITKRYPSFKNKIIHVIENISEIDRFQKDLDKENSILKDLIGFKPETSILYAGAFGKVNGLSYIIHLAEKLLRIDPSIYFILIGEGREKNKIIELANRNRVLNKNVFILKSIPKEKLPQLYYECTFGSSFVIDIEELWINSANKFFDTLAASRPVIINHRGWQQKMIKSHNIGYVLPAQINLVDIDLFVSYIKNERIIEKQKINALNLADNNFSLKVAYLKYHEILINV